MNSFEEGKKAAELNQPRKVPNKYQGDKVHKLRWLSGFDSIKIKEQKMNSFQNGVAKAEQEIMNKASQVGVKLGNGIGSKAYKEGYEATIEDGWAKNPYPKGSKEYDDWDMGSRKASGPGAGGFLTGRRR